MHLLKLMWYSELMETTANLTHSSVRQTSEALMATIQHLIPSSQELSLATGLVVDRVEFLAGDASDRTYHRIILGEKYRGGSSLVLMLLSEDEQPKLKNNQYDWVHLQALLEQNEIAVPKLCFSLPEHGCLIIEDYGDEMLESPALKAASAENNKGDLLNLYEPAFHLCAKMLTISESDSIWSKRAFDQERFEWELQFYKKYYLMRFCKLDIERSKERELDRKFKSLAAELGQQAKWFVHRDLHSRNIMVSGNHMALIDFQDARLGSAAYDLVSLCFDSYVPLSWQTRTGLLQKGIEIIRQTNEQAASEIEKTWKKVFLQRQLKVLGSFAYLKIVKEKPQYEKYIEPVRQMIADAGFRGEWYGELE